ncbi:hypothetical protein [Variovorax saccharolyticus]|uniref:hypothetical protein n=1 Tax=Variovorax saccharolyticus TaxID=3053516 RepID=UPI002575632C|nr:hypothetical protein [Variovorax sp. J31P216]
MIQPGTIVNEIMAAEDWLPTLVAAAGEPKVKEKLLTGYKAGEKTFRNHLDGYDFMPYFKGQAPGPRHEFFYFSDNADLMAVRYNAWKVSFKTIEGNLFNGKPDSTNVPLVTNLRQDPWERYQSESLLYGLVGRKALDDDSRGRHRGPLPGHLQGVPAEPGVGLLERGEGPADAAGRKPGQRGMKQPRLPRRKRGSITG